MVAVAFSSIVSAQESPNTGAYFEAGVMYARYEETNGWFTSAVPIARVGYSVNEWLAIEAMIGSSIVDTSFYAGTTLVNARFDYLSSVGGKFSVPISSSAQAYARLGMASGGVSADTAYGSAWARSISPSYGVGLQFDLNSTQYISVDYTSFYNKDGVSMSGASATYGIRF